MENTKKATREQAVRWNAVVKAIRAKYPTMSDKGVYTRARYACAK